MKRPGRSSCLGWILCLVGVGIFLLPEMQTARIERQTKRELEQLQEIRREVSVEAAVDDPLRQAVEDYNQWLFENDQPGFCEEGLAMGAPAEVYGDRLFGSIQIPVMDVILPLYLGAGERNMADGAAVLGGTSLPVGGIDTNCVIAGHRGYRGAPYFREIEKLSPGDEVIVTNPWETLRYQVEQVAIIGPTDSEQLRICPGRDLVTLITCHPYRSHGKKRYVVTCVRREDTRHEEVVPERSESLSPKASSTEPVILPEDSSAQDLRREETVRWSGAICLVLLGVWMLRMTGYRI